MGEDAGVVLRLWNIPDKASTNPVGIAERRIFDAFCRANPDIQIKALVPLQISGPASGGNEFMAVAGGVAPDVFTLSGRKVGNYFDQGFLLPLNDYLSDYKRRAGSNYKGVYAPSYMWEIAIRGEQIFCVPKSYNSQALVCRRSVFGEYGVPLRAPRDWDEFFRYAQRMTFDPKKEPGSDPSDGNSYGLFLLTGLDGGWNLMQIIFSSGGEVMRSYKKLPDGSRIEAEPTPPDFERFHVTINDEAAYNQRRRALVESGQTAPMKDLTWTLAINEPAGVDALAFYRRLMHQPWMRVDGVLFDLTPEDLARGEVVVPGTRKRLDLNDPVIRKRIYHGVTQPIQPGTWGLHVKIAMSIGGIGSLAGSADNFKDTSDIFPLPFPPKRADLSPVAYIEGDYYAINAAQKDLRVREAAWKYIEFVTSPEAQRILTQTLIEQGLAEFIRPDNLLAAGFEYELSRIPPDRLQLWDALKIKPRIMPYVEGFQHVATREMGTGVEAMMGDVPLHRYGFEYRRDPKVVLDAITTRVNREIFGNLAPEQVVKRDRISKVIIAVGVLLLGAAIIFVYKAVRALSRKQIAIAAPAVRRVSSMQLVIAALFLLPALGSIVIWSYLPLAKGTFMAFQDYKILSGTTWVGIEHFVHTFASPDFWKYLWQTFLYLSLSILLGFVPPIVLALLLHEIPKGKIVFRTIYYLPAVTTGLITLFLWKQLLYDASSTGILNRMLLSLNQMDVTSASVLKLGFVLASMVLLVALIRLPIHQSATRNERIFSWAAAGVLAFIMGFAGYQLVQQSNSVGAALLWFISPFDFEVQRFLMDPQLALIWLILPGIWAGAGPGCLIYLAALKGIPDEQYEAAEIDGAGLWSKLWNVVVPNLSGLFLINFLGAVVGGMQASQNIFVMTGGGPEDATMTVGLSIWYNAFLFLNFGLATAQAWILGAILLGFTLYQLRMFRKMEFRTARTR
ncbi:MAG: extracellular solute-binding protein [Verrucomicrobiota bacterium]|nr:extracellular solute-binding protein [Verrucomicrobiota bacterium]